jgi:16S rRNA processing protein RimM
MKVEVLTSRPQDVAAGRQVFVGEDYRAYEVRRVRLHQRALIIQLAGCDTPQQAETFRDCRVFIARKDAAPLRPHEYYHHQLIGLTAVTLEGEDLGRLVEILETGANDVYVVRGPRGEVLLPARREVIREIDLAAGIMRVQLLPGLRD